MTELQRVIARLTGRLQVPTDGTDRSYRVYTRDFDQVVKAGELNAVIGPLSRGSRAGLDEAWDAFQGALQGWRVKLQLSSLDASIRAKAATSDEVRADTIVAILIDHSGSMRGQNILMAAAAADIAQDFLSHLGVGVEVLGFTTSTWKGGRARRRWRCRGRRRNPGRLCDLLYIVYRSGDDLSPGGAGWSFRPMLRPDLLKENVDGEAIEWAVGRLRAYPQSRKVLLVVSDGAPVDDSTLLANDKGYLDRHLRDVIAKLDACADIGIAAIGIGADVSRYYSKSCQVATPDDLGSVMLEMIETLICHGTWC